MTVAHTDSLLGRTWNLRVGFRDGGYTVEPADWNPRTDLIVDNVEGLCRKVLNAANDRLPERLEAADYDESLGFLLGRTVEIVPGYRPRDHRSQLGAWLKQALAWDLLDYWERVHGRHGQKRVVDHRRREEREYDVDPRHDLELADPHDDPRDRRLGGAAVEVTEDGPEARADAYRRFVVQGDREVLRSVGGLGFGARRPPETGHPGADQRADEEAA